jgi:NTE family protein
MAKTTTNPAPAGYDQTVLLLQGGGALGAYQAGAYQALDSGGYRPNWVVGVSIGAINASIIAGNKPENRVPRLRQFWNRITAPTAALPRLKLPGVTDAEKKAGAAGAMLAGQPGFFRPWLPMEWILRNPISFYDTSALQKTLEELIDFKLLNSGAVRLSLGAVQVDNGNNIYFDTIEREITPKHIMASGALPPGFPGVTIDGKAYWDGGLVSNTPLSYFMDHEPRKNSLVFQVDLFPAKGKTPTTLDEVAERDKDIRYSSRTRWASTEGAKQQNLRRRALAFLSRLPVELRADPVAKQLEAFACPARIDLVHLIYRPEQPQGSQKDYQFDRPSYERRWQEGQEDAAQAAASAPWVAPYPEGVGMRSFDVATGQHKI